MFDDKKASLSCTIANIMIGGWVILPPYNGSIEDTLIVNTISRSLVSMDNREREFLRTAFLLFNRSILSKEQYKYYLFSFVNGNGKASVETFGNCIDPYSDKWTKFGDLNKLNLSPIIKVESDAYGFVKRYTEKEGGSVDQAINSLLKVIEKLDNSDLFKIEINRRLRGGGVWLSESDIHGSAFQADGQYKLKIGSLHESKDVLNYSGEGSLITIAPPGSGKTQCFVLPNMLSWQSAAFVLDIKGEIYSATHKWRSQNVGSIYKFSPLDPTNSHSYNPLVFIRQNSDYIWEDSRFLADMMIVPSGGSDPFWENMARDVVTAAIAYVSMYNPPDDRPMSNVLDLIYGIGWDEMVMALKTNVMVSAMRQTGYALSEIEKKTKDSVLKTAQSSLSAWQGERISKVTRKSDWSPLDLRHGKPTVYICINPNEIDSYLSVLRVIIAQHIRMLTSELPPRDTAPVLFMLDELPKLKKMLPVEEALNIGRQYGIRLWMFAQSYGQLKEAYSNPEGLLGSCTVRTFMNVPLNDELATKLSDQLGYREGPLDSSRQKLVEPLELAGPEYRDIALVLATNTKPAKVRKAFAWQDEELKSRMTL